ncbi:MAG: TerB family tellurite resistance protein [Betaproteobacteria bacterium]|nr:TerB family tellurite resistance protein [Betaproteobacteria bacterium]MDH4325509.1 TerB family tellurite resistance protein [Betaproteobacteria bacterium]MDH5211128.1 TerB family tellurite resistance protein [Betaproteobacteria bacterium]MDH5578155.1 TerB family tellurite resistance protein [Betaproteobacteria bacterium]
MLKALTGLFDRAEPRPVPGFERRHLQVAVAALLHEASRADYAEGDDEHAVARAALADLFGLPPQECVALLKEGRARAAQLSSFYAPVTVIKRDYALAERIRLVEHLWRVVYADAQLNPYEDHYVRKIAHLLHVPNTQCMLARNRARG